MVDVVVVGGGIAGLTAAWDLRDREVLLLEAGGRVGGRMMSLARGRYWLNLGAHLFGGPGSLMDALASEMDLETRLIPGSRMALAHGARIVVGGAAETYPLRLPLGLGGRISFATAGVRLRRLTTRWLRAAAAGKAGDPVPMQRMLDEFGDATMADSLGRLHPQAAMVFDTIARRLTVEPAALSAVAGAALLGSVWGDSNALARNLIGGTARVPEQMAHRLGNRIVRGAEVYAVQQDETGVQVKWRGSSGEGGTRARTAIVAAPAYAAREIIAGLPADTADALARITYGPFVCVALLTGETGPVPWDPIYALAVTGRSFNMFFNHANVLRRAGAAREDGGSVMVYSGGALAQHLLQMDDEAIERTVLEDLYPLFPPMRGLVRETVVQRWPRAMPYAHPGRHHLQPALERPLGRVLLAGDYLSYFAEMEAAAASGRRAATRARELLAE